MVGKALSIYLPQMYDKERQKRPGFTWKQWAREAGVPLATLIRLKNGTTQDPQYSTIAAIMKPVSGSMEELQRIADGLSGDDENPVLEPPAASPVSPAEHVEVIRAAQADTAQRYSEALMREGEERKRAYDNHIRSLEANVQRLEHQNGHLRLALFCTMGVLVAALIALVVVMISNQQAEIVEEIAEMAGMGKAA